MKPQIHTGRAGRLTRAFPATLSAFPKWRLAALGAVLVLAGCEMPLPNTEYKMATTEKLPRPSRVLVYDFAATAAELPADAPIGARLSRGATVSTEQIATDRQL